ncbi:hypothetical protein [Streptomyces sp. G45]|uniref:hypothetical protein n=1 Tax=Streptomyces sp. G45 TaxID=3406627 RepID=UPI003C29A0EB
MRARAIAADLLTTAALTTLALQPSHASTVPEAAPASRATAAVVSVASPAAPAASWHYIDDYWTYRGCVTAGSEGVDLGRWSKFKCVDAGAFWDLYVWY